MCWRLFKFNGKDRNRNFGNYLRNICQQSKPIKYIIYTPYLKLPKYMKYLLFFILFLFNSPSMASGEETYKAVCSICHATGLNKAPMVGDKKQWGKLIKEGQAHITSDGYHGVGAMPPKGGKSDLTVAEFSSAVVYMANQTGANWKEPDEAMLKDINKRIAKKQSKP